MDHCTSFFFIYVTCPDQTVADVIARGAVEARLAACANLLPGMRSVYRWQGEVESADEVVLLLKTIESRLPELMAWVRVRHPYRTPCIVALPIVAGDADFLAWIAAETKPASGPGMAQ
jgi:periplasmic divalent cation tolerance protein